MQKELFYKYAYPGILTAVELCSYYNYTRASAVQKDAVCNGAGPRRFGWLVPDNFWGLCITEAADNHDWDYQWGETIEDKKQADRTFRNNCQRLAEALRAQEEKDGNGWWVGKRWREYKHLRRLEMIDEYFKAVDSCGGPAFWKKEDVGFKWTDIA